MANVGIDGGHGRTLLDVAIDVSSGTTQLVAAPAAPNRIKVVSYVVVADAACTAKFQSATTDKSGAMSFAANGGAVVPGQASSPWFACAAGEALNIVTTGAVKGHLTYILEP